MKIVFMGTPDFPVPTLEALIRGGHQVAAVVTQPDKPKGRGKAVLMTPVKEKAMEYGIPVYQPARVKQDDEFFQVLKVLSPDAVVVETGGSLFDRLSLAGGELILSTLEKAEKGTLVRTKQPEEGACYAGMLDKALGKIDWSRDAEAIERLIRGLNPWPSAYTAFEGRTLKLWEAEVTDEFSDGQDEYGRIVKVEKDSFLVKTGKGCLRIRQLQLEGKKRMDTCAFLRGYPVKEGIILG